MAANLVLPITSIDLWLLPKVPNDKIIIRTEIAAPLRGFENSKVAKLILTTLVSRDFGEQWIEEYLRAHIHGVVPIHKLELDTKRKK